MASKGGRMLTGTEKRVLRSLRRKGEVRGVRALAQAATGSNVDAAEVDVLRDCLDTAMHLTATGHITMKRLPGTVTLQLTEKGAKLARSLEPAFHRRHPVVVAAASLGTAVAVAGCSLLAPKPQPATQYVPEPPPTAQAAQVHKPTPTGSYWTYCEKDCPQPTPKTYRADDPPTPRQPATPAVEAQTVSLSADVLFDFDSASVTPRGRKVLDDLGEKLKAEGTLTINVVGYTDRLGTDDYNLKLSQKRAEAVKGHLSTFVDAASIKATGRGKEHPVTEGKCAKNQTAAKLVACLQPDRRVEINVTQLKR